MARNAEMLLALGLAQPGVAYSYHDDLDRRGPAVTSSNSTGYPRPRGRAPAGQSWDHVNGRWVSMTDEGTAKASTTGRLGRPLLRFRPRTPIAQRPKRAAATKARQDFAFAPFQPSSESPSSTRGHRFPDPEPRRTPADGGLDLHDRIEKSLYFNQLSVGAQVKIVANYKCGHHDVTSSSPGLRGCVATVVKVPIYPSTWVALELETTGEVVKVRTSQMVQLCDGTSASATATDGECDEPCVQDDTAAAAATNAAATTTDARQSITCRRGKPGTLTTPKADGDRVYNIERFLQARAGKILVKWLGFPLHAATWEPFVKLREDMGSSLMDQELAQLTTQRRPAPTPALAPLTTGALGTGAVLRSRTNQNICRKYGLQSRKRAHLYVGGSDVCENIAARNRRSYPRSSSRLALRATRL